MIKLNSGSFYHYFIWSSAIVTKKSGSSRYVDARDQYNNFPCTGTITPITVHQVLKRQIDENIQIDHIYLNTMKCGVGAVTFPYDNHEFFLIIGKFRLPIRFYLKFYFVREPHHR